MPCLVCYCALVFYFSEASGEFFLSHFPKPWLIRLIVAAFTLGCSKSCSKRCLFLSPVLMFHRRCSYLPLFWFVFVIFVCTYIHIQMEWIYTPFEIPLEGSGPVKVQLVNIASLLIRHSGDSVKMFSGASPVLQVIAGLCVPAYQTQRRTSSTSVTIAVIIGSIQAWSQGRLPNCLMTKGASL